jgi:glycosyltransferase involved in cell wall biosynthesis
MPSVYAAADVLMLTSDQETWGLVCNEALACGRPIAVSDAVGCADDLAADDVAGGRFPTGDASAAAKLLDRLMASPPSPEAIKDRIDRYSLAAAADGVLAGLDFVRRQ